MEMRNKNINIDYVALTFDDGPNLEYTPRILDILKYFRAKATFFVVGKKAKKYPGLLKRISEEGHEIANHTYYHSVKILRRKESIEREIKVTEKIIRRTTGQTPVFFRLPCSSLVLNAGNIFETAKKEGYLSAKWSTSSIDWLGSSKIIESRILKRKIYPGEILLFHDGSEKAIVSERDATIELLPRILNRFFLEDLMPVTLSELTSYYYPDEIIV